jgi:hypothetical protein
VLLAYDLPTTLLDLNTVMPKNAVAYIYKHALNKMCNEPVAKAKVLVQGEGTGTLTVH